VSATVRELVTEYMQAVADTEGGAVPCGEYVTTEELGRCTRAAEANA
jgi:hypothetical protein